MLVFLNEFVDILLVYVLRSHFFLHVLFHFFQFLLFLVEDVFVGEAEGGESLFQDIDVFLQLGFKYFFVFLLITHELNNDYSH